MWAAAPSPLLIFLLQFGLCRVFMPVTAGRCVCPAEHGCSSLINVDPSCRDSNICCLDADSVTKSFSEFGMLGWSRPSLKVCPCSSSTTPKGAPSGARSTSLCCQVNCWPSCDAGCWSERSPGVPCRNDNICPGHRCALSTAVECKASTAVACHECYQCHLWCGLLVTTDHF